MIGNTTMGETRLKLQNPVVPCKVLGKQSVQHDANAMVDGVQGTQRVSKAPNSKRL